MAGRPAADPYVAREPAPTRGRDSWSTLAEALGLLLHGRTARTAAPVALLVGTLLSLVNQGATVAGGHATGGTWLRVGVNYLVPFLVASYGWLSARRRPR